MSNDIDELKIPAGYDDLCQEDKDYIAGFCTPENFYKIVNALTFYADSESYFAIGFAADRPCGEFADDFSDVTFVDEETRAVIETKTVPGKTARSALKDVFKDLSQDL